MSNTYELGRIGLVIRGEYNESTAYASLDVVTYNGSSYVCKAACTNILPTEESNWNLMAQGYPVDFQGEWQDLTLLGNVTDANLGDGHLRFRREGNHVFVCGGVTAAWNGSSATAIASLPEGYRPKYSSVYFLRACSGRRVARFFITTGGGIYLEWVVNISDGSYTTSSIWLECSLDFWTD